MIYENKFGNTTLNPSVPSPFQGEGQGEGPISLETRHRHHPIILEHAREMRHPQTAAEATVWRHLRNRNLEFKFRRQHPIDRFIIDFYCPEIKLCIEIDGESHLEKHQQEYDAARTQHLESLGCTVVRFTNEEVQFRIVEVVQKIVQTCELLKNKKIT